MDIAEQIKQGTLSPSEALDKFGMGDFTLLGDVPLESLKAETLDCGLAALNERMIFEKGSGDLIVLAAYPSHGKSALMMQICEHIAATSGPVLVLSSEMSKKTLVLRSLTSATKESVLKIKGPHQFSNSVVKEHARLKANKVYVSVKDAVSIHTLSQAVRSAVRVVKPRPVLIAVDHIQNIEGTDKFNRANEVGGVSKALKRLALDLEIPILALSQLNADPFRRGYSQQNPCFIPTMHDLRESGGIKQDADAIIMLSRHEMHMPGKRVGEADIALEKVRNGETGRLVFRWDGPSMRLTETAEIDTI